MNKKAISVGIVTLLASFSVLSAYSAPQVAKKGDGYLFRYKWTKGKTYNYNYSTAFTVPGMVEAGKPQDAAMTLKVKSVSNGKGTVEITAGGQKETVTIDSMGKASGNSDLQGMDLPTLPKNPVKVGGTWKVSDTTTTEFGSLNVDSTYTFAGFKTVNSKKMVIVNSKLKMSGGSISGSGTGAFLIDPADGMMYRGTIKSDMKMSDPSSAQAMSARITILISRK